MSKKAGPDTKQLHFSDAWQWTGNAKEDYVDRIHLKPREQGQSGVFPRTLDFCIAKDLFS